MRFPGWTRPSKTSKIENSDKEERVSPRICPNVDITVSDENNKQFASRCNKTDGRQETNSSLLDETVGFEDPTVTACDMKIENEEETVSLSNTTGKFHNLDVKIITFPKMWQPISRLIPDVERSFNHDKNLNNVENTFIRPYSTPQCCK